MISSSGSYGKIMSKAAALRRNGGLTAADLPAWLGDVLARFCAANPGTFCFSRLIYVDPSWVPQEIEYGILAEGRFRVEQFSNAPA